MEGRYSRMEDKRSEETSPVSGSVSNSGSQTSASKEASMRTNARRRHPSVRGKDTNRIFFSLFPELEYISSRPVTGFSLSSPLYSGLKQLKLHQTNQRPHIELQYLGGFLRSFPDVPQLKLCLFAFLFHTSKKTARQSKLKMEKRRLLPM